MRKRLLSLLLALVVLFTCACGAPQSAEESEKLQVVTTLFPYYDFVRAIGGERVEPTLLLPPGMEPHSFEPTPLDVVTLSRADVLIYNGGSGEIWVEEILDSADRSVQHVLCAMAEVEIVESEVVEGMEDAPHAHDHDEDFQEEHHQDEDSDHVEYDEHIWTSPVNAMAIAAAVCETLTAADPEGAAYYEENLTAYLAELTALHEEFLSIRENAARDLLLFGDRFPLLYFCKTYDLRYRAAFHGCAGDTEPGLGTIKFLIDLANAEDIPVVFTIELSSGKVANVISESSSAVPRTFYSLQNISRDDFNAGETYLSLMWKNTQVLKEALS